MSTPAVDFDRFDRQYDAPVIYQSPERPVDFLSRHFPSLMFYLRLCGPVPRLCWMAMTGRCSDAVWVRESACVGRVLESVGCRVRIEGLDNITAVEGPCVFISNHMSTLETFLLPSIIRPRKPVTFVVKRVLTTMPAFGPVMRSRDPIVVGRVNPREDLAAVLEGGVERLRRGVSIIVFPQSTRSLRLERAHFNSIGVKLARKAGVPVIPLAVKTDAWGQGRYIKDCGKVRPDVPVHFRFGEALRVGGNGRAEHDAVYAFIASALRQWGGRVED